MTQFDEQVTNRIESVGGAITFAGVTTTEYVDGTLVYRLPKRWHMPPAASAFLRFLLDEGVDVIEKNLRV